jgi:hypothetical protein
MGFSLMAARVFAGQAGPVQASAPNATGNIEVRPEHRDRADA